MFARSSARRSGSPASRSIAAASSSTLPGATRSAAFPARLVIEPRSVTIAGRPSSKHSSSTNP
ncbi:MAG TPA: hypothetical protein ENJ09_08210 [Planctomycetes bacterium]|nr:hypothetical protein [Planctomycetota bacterium]